MYVVIENSTNKVFRQTNKWSVNTTCKSKIKVFTRISDAKYSIRYGQIGRYLRINRQYLQEKNSNDSYVKIVEVTELAYKEPTYNYKTVSL